ncbi:hypothetical protein P7C70_g716, partial [Phenoliferia sp. Uapishka_3]
MPSSGIPAPLVQFLEAYPHPSFVLEAKPLHQALISRAPIGQDTSREDEVPVVVREEEVIANLPRDADETTPKPAVRPPPPDERIKRSKLLRRRSSSRPGGSTAASSQNGCLLPSGEVAAHGQSTNDRILSSAFNAHPSPANDASLGFHPAASTYLNGGGQKSHDRSRTAEGAVRSMMEQHEVEERRQKKVDDDVQDGRAKAQLASDASWGGMDRGVGTGAGDTMGSSRQDRGVGKSLAELLEPVWANSHWHTMVSCGDDQSDLGLLALLSRASGQRLMALLVDAVESFSAGGIRRSGAKEFPTFTCNLPLDFPRESIHHPSRATASTTQLGADPNAYRYSPNHTFIPAQSTLDIVVTHLADTDLLILTTILKLDNTTISPLTSPSPLISPSPTSTTPSPSVNTNPPPLSSSAMFSPDRIPSRPPLTRHNSAPSESPQGNSSTQTITRLSSSFSPQHSPSSASPTHEFDLPLPTDRTPAPFPDAEEVIFSGPAISIAVPVSDFPRGVAVEKSKKRRRVKVKKRGMEAPPGLAKIDEPGSEGEGMAAIVSRNGKSKTKREWAQEGSSEDPSTETSDDDEKHSGTITVDVGSDAIRSKFLPEALSPQDKPVEILAATPPTTEPRSRHVVRSIFPPSSDPFYETLSHTPMEYCQQTLQSLESNPFDLPFALLYTCEVNPAGGGAPTRLSESGRTQSTGDPAAATSTVRLTLQGTIGVPGGHPSAPSTASFKVDLSAPTLSHESDASSTTSNTGSNATGSTDASTPMSYPFRDAFTRKRPIFIQDLAGRTAGYTARGWPDAPRNAVCIPILVEDDTVSHPRAMLVVGLNPRRPWNEGRISAKQLCRLPTDPRADELVQLDAAKSAFFSNVSHELRTPLTLILGPLDDVLTARENLQPADRDRLAVVQRHATRLLNMVNSLLDFSRIETGRTSLIFRPTRLSQLTVDLASLFRSAVERGGVKFIVDAEPDPTDGRSIFLSPEIWEKVVFNLVGNAFKYTLAGSITCRVRFSSSEAVVQFSDTGCGIADENLGRIFERFHRIENTSRSREGTGIGLALTLELVKTLGATIDVVSQLGQGSTFSVTIPRGSAHLPSAQVSAEAPQDLVGLPARASRDLSIIQEAASWKVNSPSKTSTLLASPSASARSSEDDHFLQSADLLNLKNSVVLLVDDNEDLRAYVGSVLKKAFRVVQCRDGQEALDYCLRSPPDLVCSDIMMPRLDGWGLLSALRANPMTAFLPIIFLSAKAGPEARIEALNNGADDYLVKPFQSRYGPISRFVRSRQFLTFDLVPCDRELVARCHVHLQLGKLRKELEKRVEERTRALIESEVSLEVGPLRGPLLNKTSYQMRYRGLADRYSALSLLSPVGVFLCDAEGEVTYANPRFYDISQLLPSSPVSSWPEAILDEDRAEVLRLWKEAIATQDGVPKLMEFRFAARKNWVQLELRSFHEEKTKRGFVGSVTDITRAKEIEALHLASLQQRAHDAEETTRQKELYIDSVSHELRNPLSGVYQNAELLRESLERFQMFVEDASNGEISEEEAASLLPEIIESCEAVDSIILCALHQGRIVDDVLNVSRLNMDLLEINPTPFDVTARVNEVLKMFEIECSQKRIELHLLRGPGIKALNASWVVADHARVAQILLNFLSNSIKVALISQALNGPSANTDIVELQFTAESEEKRITVHLDAMESLPPPPVRGMRIPSATKELPPGSVWLFVAVEDSGRGLTEDDLSVLFERFTQAQPKGSTFALALPVPIAPTPNLPTPPLPRPTSRLGLPNHRGHRPSSQAGSPRSSMQLLSPEPAREPPQEPPRVLLVEDNLINQRVLMRQMKQKGYTVTIANHGKEALDILLAMEDASPPAGFDVLLFDVEILRLPEQEQWADQMQPRMRAPNPAGHNDPFHSHLSLPAARIHTSSSQPASPTAFRARFVELFSDEGARNRRNSTGLQSSARNRSGKQRERERSGSLPTSGETAFAHDVALAEIATMGKRKVGSSASTPNLNVFTPTGNDGGPIIRYLPVDRTRTETTESGSSHSSTLFIRGHSASHSRTYSGASTAPSTPNESTCDFHAGEGSRPQRSFEQMRRGSPNLLDPRFSALRSGKSPAPGALGLGSTFKSQRLIRSHSTGGGGRGESFVATLYVSLEVFPSLATPLSFLPVLSGLAPLLDPRGRELTGSQRRGETLNSRVASSVPFQPAQSGRRGSLPILSFSAPAPPRSQSPNEPQSTQTLHRSFIRQEGRFSEVRHSASQPNLRNLPTPTPSTHPPSQSVPRTLKKHRSTSVSKMLSPTYNDLHPSAPHGAVPVSLCEAFTFPRPRLAAVSPPTSPESDRTKTPDNGRADEKGKSKEIDGSAREVDVKEDGSVRRVILENRASQLERTLWSEEGLKRSRSATVRRRKAKARARSESRARASGEESGEEGLGLGIDVETEGSMGKGTSIERRIAERRGERERKEKAKMGGWNSGEGEGARARLHSNSGSAQISSSEHNIVPEINYPISPPITRSFDPFAAFVGRLRGMSASRSRDRLKPKSSDLPQTQSSSDLSHLSGVLGATSAPRKRSNPVLHQPFPEQNLLPRQHLRSSPSVDSLYSRPNVLTRRFTSQSDDEGNFGQAITSLVPNSPERVRIDRDKNAFMSLPPHLHHLLMEPRIFESRRESFIPSRVPPPIPYDSPPFSSSSPRFPPPLRPRSRIEAKGNLPSTAANSGQDVHEHMIYPASPPESPAPPLVQNLEEFSWMISDEEERLISSTPTSMANQKDDQLHGTDASANISNASDNSRSPSHAPSIHHRRHGVEGIAPSIVTAASMALGSTKSSHTPTLASPDRELTPTTQGSRKSSMLDLDAEGSRFDDLFFRPPSPSSGLGLSIDALNQGMTLSATSDGSIRLERESNRPRSFISYDEDYPPDDDEPTLTLCVVSQSPLTYHSNRQSVRSQIAEPGAAREIWRMSESVLSVSGMSEESGEGTADGSDVETLGSTLACTNLPVKRGDMIIYQEDRRSSGEEGSLEVGASVGVIATPVLGGTTESHGLVIETNTSNPFSEIGRINSPVDVPTSPGYESSTCDETFRLPSTPRQTDDKNLDTFATHSAHPSPNPRAHRPLPTPTQKTWARTSFAREYLGSEDGTDTSDRHHSAPSSQTSFLDFTTADNAPPSAPPQLESFRPLRHHSSFLEFDDEPSLRNREPFIRISAESETSFLDWSPPPSPVASRNRPLDLQLEGPTRGSPISSSSLQPQSATLPFNRPSSSLSINSAHSNDLHRNSTSALSGYSGNASNTSLIATFPDPPNVAELTEPFTFRHDEEMEDLDDKPTLQGAPSTSHATIPLRKSCSLPRLSCSNLSLTDTSEWTVESPDTEESGVRKASSVRNEGDVRELASRPFDSSYLDLSTSPERNPCSPIIPQFPSLRQNRNAVESVAASEDAGAKRSSVTSWLTFFSGGRQEMAPSTILPVHPSPGRRHHE